MAVGVRPLASVGAFPQDNFGRERPPFARAGCLTPGLTPGLIPRYAVPRQRQSGNNGGGCPWSTALARLFAACATIAGRPVLGGLGASRGAPTGGVRPLPPPSPRPSALTRCRVVRGGGVMPRAERRGRLGGAADGLAPRKGARHINHPHVPYGKVKRAAAHESKARTRLASPPREPDSPEHDAPSDQL